jgi:hypothetical protein
MPAQSMVLTIEGPKRRGGHIRVTDFVREIQLFVGALRQTERQVNPAGEASIFYEIIHLSHSSPAQVVIQAQPMNPQFDLRDEVLNSLFTVVREIQTKGTASRPVSHEILEDLAGMASPVGRTLQSVSIATETETFQLTPDFQRRIEQLTEPEETYPGAVRGMLEAINLHKNANVFRIYPDIGPTKVTCHFPSELEESAIRAIGHFVEVRGTLKYKVSAAYPHEIDIESIDSFPDEAELPSLSDVRGLAPKATGTFASEEFVRRLRNAAD